MMSLEKEKERMIHELLELKKLKNKEIDQTVNLIDKAETEKELMEALVNSPLGQVATRKNNDSIVKLQELHNSLTKFNEDINNIYKKINIEEKKIELEDKIKPTRQFLDSKLQYAYEMGFDSAINGASRINCNIALFINKDSKEAWQKGQNRGLEIKKLKGLL